ncbi:MAG: hypothetical protein DRO23_05700 [Thermoprotei archaeon]|nr:MAG: hypothetical protein DRO23_05700 [Thermoprotei archaeon]
MVLQTIVTTILDIKVDYDFKLTAAAYNFSWYFNGKELLIPLSCEEPVVALVKEESEKQLQARILSMKKEVDVDKYLAKIKFVLGIEEDLKEFYNIWAKDKLFRKSLGILKGIHLRSTSLWNALLIGICQQNASFKQGWKMLAMMYKILGKKVTVERWGMTYLPPSPRDILSNINLLKACRLGYRAGTVVNVAKAFANNVLSEDKSSEYVEEDLVKVKGVGSYTARLALVLAARKYERPPIDRWLRKIISVVYKVPERLAEETWVKIWGKWGGLSSVITTIILDAETLSNALARVAKGRTYPILESKEMTPLTLWKHV